MKGVIYRCNICDEIECSTVILTGLEFDGSDNCGLLSVDKDKASIHICDVCLRSVYNFVSSRT